MRKFYLTICYFDNPGALPEIRIWEGLKFHLIIYKKVVAKNSDGDIGMITYIVAMDELKETDFEILVCIDNKSKSCQNVGIVLAEIRTAISNFLGEHDDDMFFEKDETPEFEFEFFKMLMFGKFELDKHGKLGFYSKLTARIIKYVYSAMDKDVPDNIKHLIK